MNLDFIAGYKIGEYVTVDFWYPTKTLNLLKPSEDYQDQSYVGDVLQIALIEYPFIVVRRFGKYFDGDHLKLDLRKLEIKKISDKYVEMIAGMKV